LRVRRGGFIIQRMPWQSRIASETVRRAVLAGVMVVLLAATTGLAMLMTSARTPSFDPAQPTHHFGDFVVSIPTNFTSQRDSRPDKPGVRSFVDTNQQLVLKIAVIDDAQRRPPVIALEQAKALLAPTAISTAH